jgi:hypothetical protein
VIDSPQARAYRYRSLPVGVEAPGRAAGYMTDGEWLGQITATLPVAWQTELRGVWSGKWAEHEGQRQAANLEVLHAVRELQDAQKAGLRPDASDEQIRARARVFAGHYRRGVSVELHPVTVVARYEKTRSIGAVGGPSLTAVEWAMGQMKAHGMGDFWPGWVSGKPGKVDKKKTVAACLARVSCEQFWRRTLRKVFAKTVERCSIGLGLVNKDRACYVSDLSVARRRQQVMRNAEALERTELENEYGQRMKLSDLAAKSTANKTVRRAELMTRISGFDVVAKDLGHEATFVTVTCPSRMHKWTDAGRGVVPNKKHDGTTPGEAQAYLSGQWAKCRAAMQRRGIEVYGFRVAEPHHDGCPHWHLLLFHGQEVGDKLREMFVRYFLENDSPNERGADLHRVKFERIDRSKGSAAAYIAKYIAKNVDGYGVGVDLYGAPAVESSQRVDAWAATWRIRQFQQLGGAPVTVWRELRRVNPEDLPGNLLPVELKAALSAVNIGQTGALWAHGWAAYIQAQGGPCASRKHRAIRLLKVETGEVNRYTEVKPADTVGIECNGRSWHKPRHMVEMLGDLAPSIPRPAAARIESERAQWRVVGAGESQPFGEAGRPWTRVNNCTREAVVRPHVMRDSVLVQRGKLGRYRSFNNIGRAGGPSIEGNAT